MTRAPQLSSPLGLLLGLALSTSCWHRAGDHCANLAGDQTCAERGSGAFCDACAVANDGCIDVMPAGDCHFAGSGEGSSTSSTSSDGEAPAEETTLEPGTASSVTTDPQGCGSDEECTDVVAPFCGAGGVCVACDGMGAPEDACASLDPELPVCANGMCGECDPEEPTACSGTTPVCDDGSNTCVACSEHVQCGEAACNFFTGECLPANAVVHVGPGQDFATLTDAANSFGMGAEGTIIVHEQKDAYNDAFTVDGGRVLAFLANGGDQPSWDNGVGVLERHLTVTDGTVLMDGLTLFQYLEPDSAMLVVGGRAWIDRSRIVNNNGGGIRGENGAELTLRNCFIGDGTNGVNGITVEGASATILYSTIGSGYNNFEDVFPVFCSGDADVSIRNSLLVSFDDAGGEISCTATVTNTASETLILGAGNEALGNVGMNWFAEFTTGDFHLDMPPAAISTTAQWKLGDPLTDIDGDSRPDRDGTLDYAGADLPQ